MSDWRHDATQVELFYRRSLVAGINRRTFLKFLASVAGATFASSFITSCARPAAAPAPPKTSDTISRVPDAEQVLRLPYFNEPASHDFNKNLYCGGEPNLFAGLTRLTPDFKPVPYAAQLWELKDNGATYIFKMADGARWTNGDSVTAHDFEWSFKRLLNPATQAVYVAILYDVKNAEAINTEQAGFTIDMLGVKALDAQTLEIKLEGPRGYFPFILAYAATLPSHRKSVEMYGDKWWGFADFCFRQPCLDAPPPRCAQIGNAIRQPCRCVPP